MRRSTLPALLLGLLVGGCQAVVATPTPAPESVAPPSLPAPTAEPTRSLSPQARRLPPPDPTPPPESTDGPMPEEDSLPTSASVERDGVKVTLEVGTNPLIAGQETWLRTTLTNTGQSTLRWMVDGCGTNLQVRGRLPGVTWRHSQQPMTPQLHEYRAWMIEEAGVDGPIWLWIDERPGSDPRFSGCADVGIGRELKPGKSARQVSWWDGQAAPMLGLPPTAPAVLSATFSDWYRGGGEEASEEAAGEIEVVLDSWITWGRDEAFLSPFEVIDTALGNEELASWLVEQPLKSGADAIAEYDVQAGIWLVGLQIYRDDHQPLFHGAFVDPITGEVIAIREHPIQF